MKTKNDTLIEVYKNEKLIESKRYYFESLESCLYYSYSKYGIHKNEFYTCSNAYCDTNHSYYENKYSKLVIRITEWF